MPVSNHDAKDWAREKVRSLWSTPPIPMRLDGSIDYDGIRRNVEYVVGLGIGGTGFGFTEAPTQLSIAERREAFKVFLEAIDGRILTYCHPVDQSVPETIEMTKYCASLGYDAVMLWVPLEFAKSDEMSFEWYEYVASQVEIPIMAYNTYHSGRNLGIPAICRIAEIENIVAIKDAVNDFGHTIAALQACGNKILVSNPLEEYLPAMLQYTDQQVMLGTTSVFLMQSPKYQPIIEYMRLMEGGKPAEAWSLYYELKSLRDIWNSIYTVLWNKTAAEHPIGLIKYWMDLMGMRGGSVRPPIAPTPQADKERLKTALLSTGWLEKLGVQVPE